MSTGEMYIDRLQDERDAAEARVAYLEKEISQIATLRHTGDYSDEEALLEFMKLADTCDQLTAEAEKLGMYPRARLDPDGTAKPKTEIAAVFPLTDQCIGFPHQIIEYKVRPTDPEDCTVCPADYDPSLSDLHAFALGHEEALRREPTFENLRARHAFAFGASWGLGWALAIIAWAEAIKARQPRYRHIGQSAGSHWDYRGT